MPYKHKVTGEIYDLSRISSFGGKITKRFRPWDNSLDDIVFTVSKIINTDAFPTGTPAEKYREAEPINNAPMDKLVDETFDEVVLTPEIKVVDQPKYVKVIVEMSCPLCGSLLKTDGGAYLTSPLQYDHVCTNPKCNYHTCMSRWYAGQKLWALSKEDAYRIIKSGTEEEKEELERRKMRE